MWKAWRRFAAWVVDQEIDRPLWLDAKLRVQIAFLLIVAPIGALAGVLVGLAAGFDLPSSAAVGIFLLGVVANIYVYVAVIRARRRRALTRDRG